MWIPNSVTAETNAIPSASLSSQYNVCDSELGQFSDQTRGRPWSDGTTCDSLPGAHQHLQQC